MPSREERAAQREAAKRKKEEEAAAAAVAAPAAEEGSETPKKVRKTTARKAPKDKKKAEAPPEPIPEAAAAAAAEAEAPVPARDDVLGLLFGQLTVGVPEGTTDDQKMAALDAAITEVMEARPEVTYETILYLEDVQEQIVMAAQAKLAPPPPAPLDEPGSAAAAAAAAPPSPVVPPSPAVAPTEDALLTAARKLPPIAAKPAPAPDTDEEEESPVPLPAAVPVAAAAAAVAAASAAPGTGFAPTPVPTPEFSQASSMSATNASLSSASSMGSVDEEVEVLRLRRIKELIASEGSAAGASFPEYGERVVDFAELRGADTEANPIFLFELVRPAEEQSVKALGLAVLYSITGPGGVRTDHVRILALGARTGEPISSVSNLLKRFAQALGRMYPVQLPGGGSMLNPNIVIQYVRNQAPKDKANLAATLKELTPKFAFAPYNLQGWQTGLDIPGGPIWQYDTIVKPTAAGVAGTVSYRYTSYQPAEEKTVDSTAVTKVQAFNPISLKWEPSATCVLLSMTGILAEEHPLVLPAGKDAYTWTLSRLALTGTAQPPLTPFNPTLPGKADDLIRMPRGGRRRTQRKRATSRQSS